MPFAFSPVAEKKGIAVWLLIVSTDESNPCTGAAAALLPAAEGSVLPSNPV
jgi:hypothetical protein